MLDAVFFDFDGVILDSVDVRTSGFRHIFRKFDERDVDKLIDFHVGNGGISRFYKIRYFYEEILDKGIDEARVFEYADEFSDFVSSELIHEKYVIKETVDFIKSSYRNIPMHIVSGSEEIELKGLCKAHDIAVFFNSIHGSPRKKEDNLRDLLLINSYRAENCVMIGDSINDYDAAIKNNIAFFGYNNESLKNKAPYIETFKGLDLKNMER